MHSYRNGDLVTISGQVRQVEGDYLMISLEGALDTTPPAMVLMSSATLVRASVHVGDEVKDGYMVHSMIPGTPLVLLRNMSGDPSDPETFRTAVLSSLDLVAAGGTESATSTPAQPQTAEPAIAAAADDVQAPPSPQVEQHHEGAQAPVSEGQPEGGSSETEGQVDAVDESLGQDEAPALSPEGPAVSSDAADIASPSERAPEQPSNVVSMEAAARPSLASLGTVREQQNPLKASEDELLLRDVIDDDKGTY